MQYILYDLILNTYLNIPSFMIILSLQENKKNFLYTILLIQIIFKIKITIFFILLYIIYKNFLKGYNPLLKNLIFLLFFLIYASIFYHEIKIIYYFIFNIPLYIISNKFKKNSISVNRMIKQ